MSWFPYEFLDAEVVPSSTGSQLLSFVAVWLVPEITQEGRRGHGA